MPKMVKVEFVFSQTPRAAFFVAHEMSQEILANQVLMLMFFYIFFLTVESSALNS
jgi:hypothetical protein